MAPQLQVVFALNADLVRLGGRGAGRCERTGRRLKRRRPAARSRGGRRRGAGRS